MRLLLLLLASQYLVVSWAPFYATYLGHWRQGGAHTPSAVYVIYLWVLLWFTIFIPHEVAVLLIAFTKCTTSKLFSFFSHYPLCWALSRKLWKPIFCTVRYDSTRNQTPGLPFWRQTLCQSVYLKVRTNTKKVVKARQGQKFSELISRQ